MNASSHNKRPNNALEPPSAALLEFGDMILISHAGHGAGSNQKSFAPSALPPQWYNDSCLDREKHPGGPNQVTVKRQGE